MGLKLIQTCDKCGHERELSLNPSGAPRQSPQTGGWREVVAWKWLCNKCIRQTLGGS